MGELLSLDGGRNSVKTQISPEKSGPEVVPRIDTYQTAPIQQGFEWEPIINSAYEAHNLEYGHRLGRVVFRSLRRPEADLAWMTKLDERADEEAAASPGYVYYFKGDADPKGRCLSFCLWVTIEQGMASARQENHKIAAAIAPIVYKSCNIEFQHVWLDYTKPEGVDFMDLREPVVMRFDEAA